jgi:DNA topoisomerase VI subunit A
MIRLLGKAHSFLMTGTSATKRELYYQFLLNNQAQMDQCVVGVSSVLDAAPWEFGIISTAKGIVAGDLTVIFSDEKQISCEIGLYLLFFFI